MRVWPAVTIWFAGCVVIVGGVVFEGALLTDIKEQTLPKRRTLVQCPLPRQLSYSLIEQLRR